MDDFIVVADSGFMIKANIEMLQFIVGRMYKEIWEEYRRVDFIFLS